MEKIALLSIYLAIKVEIRLHEFHKIWDTKDIFLIETCNVLL